CKFLFVPKMCRRWSKTPSKSARKSSGCRKVFATTLPPSAPWTRACKSYKTAVCAPPIAFSFRSPKNEFTPRKPLSLLCAGLVRLVYRRRACHLVYSQMGPGSGADHFHYHLYLYRLSL